MKFVIRLLALCSFCLTLFCPAVALAQSSVSVQTVANYEIEPDNSPENAESSIYGSISGQAYGAAKSTATIFQVTLNGPDNPRQIYATKGFGSARAFQFDQLPPGRYWLQVSSGAGTLIKAFPNQQEFYIEPGQQLVSNVEFRAR